MSPEEEKARKLAILSLVSIYLAPILILMYPEFGAEIALSPLSAWSIGFPMILSA